MIAFFLPKICFVVGGGGMLPSSTKIEIWLERCGHDLKLIPEPGIISKLGLFLT